MYVQINIRKLFYIFEKKNYAILSFLVSVTRLHEISNPQSINCPYIIGIRHKRTFILNFRSCSILTLHLSLIVNILFLSTYILLFSYQSLTISLLPLSNFLYPTFVSSFQSMIRIVYPSLFVPRNYVSVFRPNSFFLIIPFSICETIPGYLRLCSIILIIAYIFSQQYLSSPTSHCYSSYQFI